MPGESIQGSCCPLALGTPGSFVWEVRDDAGVNVSFPCVNGRENDPCGRRKVHISSG